MQEWRPFDHPQLGAVEIGGVDEKWCFQNPPPDLLEAEVTRNTEFALVLLGALPVVKVATASAVGLGGGQHLVVLVLHNEGFLPSNGSGKALLAKAIRAKAVCRLHLGPGLTMTKGLTTTEFDHLAGRSRGHSAANPVPSRFTTAASNPHEARLEWVVKAERTGTIEVEVDFQRGGRLKCIIHVGGAGSKL